MARALLPEVVIRRYTCGMQPQAMSCLPIMVIPVGYMLWHGRPMVRALPRQAMMGQCRSGRPCDIALFFSYPFPTLPYYCPDTGQSQLLEHLIHPFWRIGHLCLKPGGRLLILDFQPRQTQGTHKRHMQQQGSHAFLARFIHAGKEMGGLQNLPPVMKNGSVPLHTAAGLPSAQKMSPGSRQGAWRPLSLAHCSTSSGTAYSFDAGRTVLPEKQLDVEPSPSLRSNSFVRPVSPRPGGRGSAPIRSVSL